MSTVNEQEPSKEETTSDATEADISNVAAPLDDPSAPKDHEGPFAVTSKELRGANKMQNLFFITLMLLLGDGLITLGAFSFGRINASTYYTLIIVFISLLVISVAVVIATLGSSARIRNKNVVATKKWVAAKYGLELTNSQAHTLNRDETVIGVTRGWRVLHLDGYPQGVQVTYNPRQGYRLVTTSGDVESELPKARANRHAV